MTKGIFIFAAWCQFVFLGVIVAAYYGWSPFSDEDDGQGTYVRGPTHK